MDFWFWLFHTAMGFYLEREVTYLAHIVNDYESNVTEHDLTHLNELIEANIKFKDFPSKEKNREVLSRKFEHRMMHHHCFDPALVISLLDYVGMQIRAVNLLSPYHIVCLSENLLDKHTKDNSNFSSKDADYLKNSPFSTDGLCHRY